jgi:hypothetical protein
MNKSFVKDQTGKLIGSVTTETSGKKTYLDAKGALVARVINDRTYDKKGANAGKGDHGMRLFK